MLSFINCDLATHVSKTKPILKYGISEKNLSKVQTAKSLEVYLAPGLENGSSSCKKPSPVLIRKLSNGFPLFGVLKLIYVYFKRRERKKTETEGERETSICLFTP